MDNLTDTHHNESISSFDSYTVMSEEESKGFNLIPSSVFVLVKEKELTMNSDSASVVPVKLTLQYILSLLSRISQSRKKGCQLQLAFYYSAFDKQKHSITSHLSKLRTSKQTPASFKSKLNFRLSYTFEKAITRNGCIFLIYTIDLVKGINIDESHLSF